VKRIYLASPYTKPDPAVNVRNAVLAADRIAKAGYAVFVPVLTHLWHMISPHDYEFWMTQDFAWIPACDAMVRLAGESVGADREVDEARRLGVPVYFGVDDLLEALAGE